MTYHTATKLAEEYAESVADFIDESIVEFLRKNLIPTEDAEQTEKVLKEKGMRIIREIVPSDKTIHTFLLVKVIDEARLVINPPTFDFVEKKEER